MSRKDGARHGAVTSVSGGLSSGGGRDFVTAGAVTARASLGAGMLLKFVGFFERRDPQGAPDLRAVTTSWSVSLSFVMTRRLTRDETAT